MLNDRFKDVYDEWTRLNTINLNPKLKDARPVRKSTSLIGISLYLTKKYWYRLLGKKYAEVQFQLFMPQLLESCTEFLYGEGAIPVDLELLTKFRSLDALAMSMAFAFTDIFGDKNLSPILHYKGTRWELDFGEITPQRKTFADFLINKKHKLTRFTRYNFLFYEFANAFTGMLTGKSKNVSSFDIAYSLSFGVNIGPLKTIRIPKSFIARQITETLIFIDILNNGPSVFHYRPTPLDRLHQYVYLPGINNFIPGNPLTLLILEIVKHNLRIDFGLILEKPVSQVKDLLNKFDPISAGIIASALSTKRELTFVRTDSGAYYLENFKTGLNQQKTIENMIRLILELQSGTSYNLNLNYALLPIWYIVKHPTIENTITLCNHDIIPYSTVKTGNSFLYRELILSTLLGLDALTGSEHTSVAASLNWL